MGWPLTPLEGVKRCAVIAVLGLLLLSGTIGPARAQDAEDPYTATVKVDATADSPASAREAARIDGQRRALAAIADRLSGGTGSGAAKLTKLDDRTITDMVASFEVANEKMSAVRYLADYTFHFRPAALQRVLRNAGVALSDQPGKEGGKPAVVLPVYQTGGGAVLWDDPNPWRDAWAQSPPATGPVPLSVPLGDISDIAAIDAAKARAGDAGALAAIGKQNGAEDAIVALATPRGPADRPSGLDIVVRRYRAGRLLDSHPESLAANPDEAADAFFGRAVVAVAADIESGWKKEPVPHYDQQGSLTAVLPINGLDDWVKVRERLAGVPTIRKVSLVALSRQEATIEIDYLGNIDQLKASLAGASLDLIKGDPNWRLARSGTPSAQ
jgi:Uncharacterized protein conserved in bacteria (DUF2066)